MVNRKKISKKVIEASKKGRGRPATGRKRGGLMGVRMSDDERAEIETAATAAGMTPGAWLLAQGLAAARK
jgi:hypothetical protein